ncbi:MAG: metalloregulator ArsR/SmtB family transcription factor [Tepidanaerobacteraceae bacterium]|jgi:ArsR family transcriptional regulator|nr:metalloregulator ArsR/SmtB family transcription factor [Tepidanaerobacteraceae bacterium]
MDKKTYKNKLARLAEILKVIGHPARLCILCKLMNKDCNVTTMQNCLDLPQSTVSQHLAVLKARGIIEGKRKGVEVIYSLVDEDVKRIINALFKPEELSEIEQR